VGRIHDKTYGGGPEYLASHTRSYASTVMLNGQAAPCDWLPLRRALSGSQFVGEHQVICITGTCHPASAMPGSNGRSRRVAGPWSRPRSCGGANPNSGRQFGLGTAVLRQSALPAKCRSSYRCGNASEGGGKSIPSQARYFTSINAVVVAGQQVAKLLDTNIPIVSVSVRCIGLCA